MRDRVTTWLDLIAALLLVTAVALAAYGVDAFAFARAAGAAGVGLLVVSWILSGMPLPRRKRER